MVATKNLRAKIALMLFLVASFGLAYRFVENWILHVFILVIAGLFSYTLLATFFVGFYSKLFNYDETKYMDSRGVYESERDGEVGYVYAAALFWPVTLPYHIFVPVIKFIFTPLLKLLGAIYEDIFKFGMQIKK